MRWHLPVVVQLEEAAAVEVERLARNDGAAARVLWQPPIQQAASRQEDSSHHVPYCSRLWRQSRALAKHTAQQLQQTHTAICSCCQQLKPSSHSAHLVTSSTMPSSTSRHSPAALRCLISSKLNHRRRDSMSPSFLRQCSYRERAGWWVGRWVGASGMWLGRWLASAVSSSTAR